MREFEEANLAAPPRPPAPATLGKFGRMIMFWSGGGAVVGLIFVLGTAFLPENLSPAHWIAVTIARMESTEVRGTMVTKAQAARLLMAAQMEEQALVASIKESMAGEVAMGQIGDLFCMSAQFFGQGRNSDYPELRDTLKMGCGLSDAARKDIVNNLVFKLRDLRNYIAELEAAAR